MTKRLKRPRDSNQLAKLVGDIAVGELTDEVEDKRDQGAVLLGKKGGKARANALTAKQRKEIATKAAKSRWKKKR